jgi:glycosyltransferase involved in cell wall biosynthesis
MAFNPKVSIIIPVYNGSNYLRKAIESAENQTYRNIEILVINDGSVDDGKTEELALSYGDRIRYFNKENGGVATALNLGIQKSQGEYISWLSHDDEYLPNKVESQVRYLEALLDKNTSGKNVVLYSDFQYIDSDSKLISMRKIRDVKPSNFILALIKSDFLNGCTTFIPKTCFTEVGLFNESLRTTQDYEMWFRLARKYDFEHVPEVIVGSRVHGTQHSRSVDLHTRECNELYEWVLGNITLDEIFGKNRSSDFASYLSLASYLRGPHRHIASKFARRLAWQHFRGSNPFVNLIDYAKFLLTMSALSLLTVIKKLVRMILEMFSRLFRTDDLLVDRVRRRIYSKNA